MDSISQPFEKLILLTEKEQAAYRVGLSFPEKNLDLTRLLHLECFPTANVAIIDCPSYEAHQIQEKLSVLLDILNVSQFRPRRIVIKPALVEAKLPSNNVTPHPNILYSLVKTLRSIFGEMPIVIAEASGHERDSELLIERTKIRDVISDLRIKFIDLNLDDVVIVPVESPLTFKQFAIPKTVANSDFIISLAKMKTHHRTGVTLGMKNLMGCLPSSIYGFPKNKAHWMGISKTIVDLSSVIKPQLTIIDGIDAMEGDGPIYGTAKKENILVAGLDVVATDIVLTQIMNFSPLLIPKFWYALAKGIMVNPNLIDERPVDKKRPDSFLPPPNISWLYESNLKSESEQIYFLGKLLDEGSHC